MKKAIVVLGMHRSGTSALTRVLNLLGATLPEKLVQARPKDNETGFWEPADAVHINEELLASVGSNWIDSSRFPIESVPAEAIRDFKSKARDLISLQYRTSELLVLKDPRISRFFPLWRDVLSEENYTTYAVLTLRSPWECAKSLQARNEYPLDAGLVSWLRYELQAEYDSRAVRRCTVMYSDLLADWRSTVGRISASLKISWPIEFDRVEGDVEDFLSAGYRHQKDEPFESTRSADVDIVLSLLRDSDISAPDPARDAQLDELRAALDAADRFYGSMIATYPELVKARRSAELQLEHETRRAAAFREQRDAWKAKAQKSV